MAIDRRPVSSASEAFSTFMYTSIGKPGAVGSAMNTVPVRSKISARPSGKKTICIGVVSSDRPESIVVSVKPAGIESVVAAVLSPETDGRATGATGALSIGATFPKKEGAIMMMTIRAKVKDAEGILGNFTRWGWGFFFLGEEGRGECGVCGLP